MQPVVADIDGEVVVDREGRVAVKVCPASIEQRIGFGAASTGDRVLHPVALESLVVVNVAIENNDLGLDAAEQGLRISRRTRASLVGRLTNSWDCRSAIQGVW